MNEWYYSNGGKQNGPVSFEQLVEIARSGGLDPVKDLVWTSTMKDWLPAGQVPGIFGAPAPAADPSNPYAPPETTWKGDLSRPTPVGESLSEIVPGSEPIDVGGCVKRGFDLTARNFGMILLVVIVYVALTYAVGIVTNLMTGVFGFSYSFSFSGMGNMETLETSAWGPMHTAGLLNWLVSQVVSIFLSLGATRIGLNVVSGKEFDLGMLFGGGKKLLPAIGATLLFTLMVAVGFMLLIAPGAYLAMRYGFYLTAMVDRDLGVMESFEYSSRITTNNRMNLFLLALLGFLIVIAGCLALCVGMFFAIPVMWLSWTVAYRWMQYGHRAALDYPGTVRPMLSGM